MREANSSAKHRHASVDLKRVMRTAKPENVVARRKVRGDYNMIDKRCGGQVPRTVALHVDAPQVGAVSPMPRHSVRFPNLLFARWFELSTLETNGGAVAGLEVFWLARRRAVEIYSWDGVHLPY